MKLTKKKQEEHEPNLKGTFVSVMILGGILIVSWLAIFALFLSRT